ncbi:MAG: tetratricopeptide repeat protein, partial [Bacteroidetes bacterium]|nr:tetratricopeptide repeat protein [Bacteroidota bacterium]
MCAQSAQVLANRANRALNNGNLEEAAFLYERAGQLRGGKTPNMLRAGDAYYRLRNYSKAANCYHRVADLALKSFKDGIQYGKSLKQSGRYQDALDVFVHFARNYQGDDKALLIPVVQREIKGCKRALELESLHDSLQNPAYTLHLLPPEINGDFIKLAPIPFSDRLLYFVVSTPDGNQLVRSLRMDNVWQKAQKAEGLPEAISRRFGSGSFSPDGKRFYCTECTSFKRSRAQIKQGITTRCEIYQTHRTEAGWSEPRRLPTYINLPGTSVLHPFVTQNGHQEMLYFASDRPGGLGGLDLYRTERSIEGDSLDFSLPQNLGNQINTPGDEVSPFFDAFNQTLWFSSNGQVGLGGFDVYSSLWEDGNWAVPQHAGSPFNSPADDLFVVFKKNGNGGYLVSNRIFGDARTQTVTQD